MKRTLLRRATRALEDSPSERQDLLGVGRGIEKRTKDMLSQNVDICLLL